MHFGGVFPQCRTLPPLLNPVNRDEVPASQTVRQFCPPMCHQLGWTWLTVHPRTKPRGVSCATADPLHAQAPLCPCANGAQHPSRPTAPIPLQKQTPNHGFYTGWTSWCIRKALFLIGIRTETAEREHELMKGTGRIFCPRVFCLVPAEKRDTLCSANELSAAITVYTAASETYPCAFWHCAPQAWMAGLGIKKIPPLCKRIKVWATLGLTNIRTLEKSLEIYILMVHLLLCMHSSCRATVISHIVGVCCCKALGPATEALQLHHSNHSNHVWHHHGRPLRSNCVQIITKYMKTTLDNERYVQVS